MPIELNYGLNSTLRFADGGGTRFVRCETNSVPLADIAAAVEQALAQPLDFFAFQQAIVPGDKLILALDNHVPQGPAIVQTTVRLLMNWGASREDISVLVPTDEVAASLNHASQDGPLRIVVHDPSKREHMAYLAATPAGEPLYLNRLLVDADLVLPIAGVRMQSGKARASDGLFPVFSTRKERPKARTARERRLGLGKPEKSPQERPDASWLLGVLCMLQAVPGPGESASAVVAGSPAAVRRECRQRCEAAWRFEIDEPASLVVAAIKGDASQQTWEQLGRALQAAAQAVAEDGAIALCCDLADEPGPGLQALAEGEDRHTTLKAIRRAQLPDAKIAAQFVQACSRARVYLLSHLPDELVENLGLAPIAEPAEVARLAQRHRSCLLLGNAQHAAAVFPE